MECRTALRSVFVTEPSRPLRRNGISSSFRISAAKKGSCGCYGIAVRAGDIRFWKRTQKLKCSHNGTPSFSSTAEEDDPPQEAVLKVISGSLPLLKP